MNDDVANRLCAQILLLAAEDPTKDISLYINSPGGSISAGMAIYDTMTLAPCDIATYAMGMAASMGEFLLAAGTKGKRYALPHARILMHQPLGGVTGSAADIAIQAEQFAVIKKEMFRLNAEFTGQPIERIEADSDRDRWFTAPKPWNTVSSTTSSPAPQASPMEKCNESSEPAPGAVHPAVVHRALQLRCQGVQPLQQAVRGTHHLPWCPGRRRIGQRHHGAAARARVAGPRPRYHHVHQLARRWVHVPDGDLRHHAVRAGRHPDGVPRSGRLGGGCAVSCRDAW
ncbi:ATP-dependent Clp protease proteolytic subunit 2 domain protein [Mycobacterium kansasii]|uniref:ATP-dependent Clp protease proteolytic subunit n=1 Tax=Mycobacterium kansasii TaxID=1768 RepID=A0A1V3XKM9_MYCKA|nr:ATP-dependent Clp protease proteolytic subunit 2 domain protein [Mycobacterium kansasii]